MRQTDTLKTNVSVSQSFKRAVKQPKPPRKKYPSPVTLRLTEDERVQLEKDAGSSSLSTYIRECVFGGRIAKRVVPAADRVLLAQILAQLGGSRMANNLSQIAHHANCGSLVLEEVTEEEINEACVHIAWMRVKLIEALGLKDRIGS